MTKRLARLKVSFKLKVFDLIEFEINFLYQFLELQKYNEETKTRINELKNTLTNLKAKAVDIKTDIQSKEKYFNTCS